MFNEDGTESTSQWEFKPSKPGVYTIWVDLTDVETDTGCDEGSRTDGTITSSTFTVHVAELEKIVVAGAPNPCLSERVGPEIVAAGGSITLEAIPKPCEAQFPENSPDWELTMPDGTIEVGQGRTFEVKTRKDAPGLYAVRVNCGPTGSKLFSVYAVKANLIVQGLAEEDEPAPNEGSSGAFISVNKDFDEVNKDSDGNNVPDNQPDISAGHRISLLDNELEKQAVLEIEGAPVNGRWRLTFPANVRAWRPDGTAIASESDPGSGHEVTVPYGAPSSAGKVTKARIPFILEGIAPSNAVRDITINAFFQVTELTIEGELQSPPSCNDDVKATVVEVDVVLASQGELEEEVSPGVLMLENDDDDDNDSEIDSANEHIDDGLDSLDIYNLSLYITPVDVLDEPSVSAFIKRATGGKGQVRVFHDPSAEPGDDSVVLGPDDAVSTDLSQLLDVDLLIEGVEWGELELDFEVAINGIMCVDKVVTTVVDVDLHLVKFGAPGTASVVIAKDDGTGPYDGAAGHWRDNSIPRNGNASDSGDLRFPVSYTRNTKMTVSCEMVVAPANTSVTATIRAVESGGRNIPPTDGSQTGGTVSIPPTESAAAFANSIGFLNPLQLDWQISINNGTTWHDVGTSDNRIYITYAAPAAKVLYETLLDIGCRNADGAAMPTAALAGIWQDFQTPIPGVRRKLMDGFNRSDDVAMTYWINWQVDPKCQSLEGMLAAPDGNGSCIAWAQLLHETLDAQGITTSRIHMITARPDVNPGADGFLVKNWTFGRHTRSGLNATRDTGIQGDDREFQAAGPHSIVILPGADGVLNSTPPGIDDTEQDGIGLHPHYPYILDADVINQPGSPGQGNNEPLPYFFNHWVVKLAGDVYDPSYGSGPFSSENDHENASIDGIKATLLINANDVGAARKNNPGVQELQYDPVPQYE